jgi:hypothetical protein
VLTLANVENREGQSRPTRAAEREPYWDSMS